MPVGWNLDAGGRKIRGITAIRNELVSFTSLTFTILNSRARKRSTIPYMLAGTGSGMKW